MLGRYTGVYFLLALIVLYVGLTRSIPVCFIDVCVDRLVAYSSAASAHDTIYDKSSWHVVSQEVAEFQKKVEDRFDDTLRADRFAMQHVELRRDEGNVDFNLPVTGEKSIDGIVRANIEGFARSRAGKDSLIVNTYAFGEYVSVVTASSQDQLFAVFNYKRGQGQVDASQFLINDGVTIATEAGAVRLMQQKGIALEKARPAIADAIAKKNIRIAQNGVVIVLDAAKIQNNPPVPYHEVLVTNEELGQNILR